MQRLGEWRSVNVEGRSSMVHSLPCSMLAANSAVSVFICWSDWWTTVVQPGGWFPVKAFLIHIKGNLKPLTVLANYNGLQSVHFPKERGALQIAIWSFTGECFYYTWSMITHSQGSGLLFQCNVILVRLLVFAIFPLCYGKLLRDNLWNVSVLFIVDICAANLFIEMIKSLKIFSFLIKLVICWESYADNKVFQNGQYWNQFSSLRICNLANPIYHS